MIRVLRFLDHEEVTDPVDDLDLGTRPHQPFYFIERYDIQGDASICRAMQIEDRLRHGLCPSRYLLLGPFRLAKAAGLEEGFVLAHRSSQMPRLP